MGMGPRRRRVQSRDKPDLGPFLQRHLEIDVVPPGRLPDVVIRPGGEDAVAAVPWKRI
jgi:hypothetical protein